MSLESEYTYTLTQSVHTLHTNLQNITVDCLETERNSDDEVHLTLNADKICQKVTNYMEENQLL